MAYVRATLIVLLLGALRALPLPERLELRVLQLIVLLLIMRQRLKPLRKARTIGELVDQAMALGAWSRNERRRETLRELEAHAHHACRGLGSPRPFAPGDRVVLTTTACRSWATVMGFPVARSLTTVWTVVACTCELCKRGRHVCTDEVLAVELEHGSDVELTLRHISVGQLKRRGELRADDGLSDGPAQPSLGAAVVRAIKRGALSTSSRWR